MRRLVDSARRGLGNALVMHGEVGIGKTALVEYAIAEARGLRIAHTSGFEPETSLAFAGLHRLLSPTPAGIDRLPRPQREALTAAFEGTRGRSSSDRFLVGSAALALLAATIAPRPLLCVVDDAHWLDQESLEALAFMARRGIDGVAFLFVVREPVEARVRFDGIPELYVGGLSSEAASALLAASMTTPVDESVLGRVIALTRQNPSTILELAAELSDSRAPCAPILPDTMPVGGRVERSFARRVQGLPPQTQLLLLLMAAEPSGDTHLVLRAASRLGLSADVSTAAAAEGLVRLGEALEFSHPAIPRAVYGWASAADRERVHHVLAAVADPIQDVDRRAWHRAAAASEPDENLAAELERTSERAIGRGGHAAAATALERASQLTPDGRRRRERALAAARAAFAAGDSPRASALLFAMTPDPAGRLMDAEEKRLRGQIALGFAVEADTAGTLRDAARTMEPLDVRLARNTHLEALLAAVDAGPFANHSVSVAEAVAIARTAPSVPDAEMTAADHLLDGLATLFGESQEHAASSLRRGVASLRSDPDLTWMVAGCHAAATLWDDEALDALSGEWIARARQSGATMSLAHALAYRAAYETIVGRFDQTEVCLEEQGQIAFATGNRGMIDRTNLGWLALAAWRGRPAETRRLSDEAVRNGSARGQGAEVSFAHAAVAVLEVGRGDYPAALFAAREATAWQSLFVTSLTLPELVEAAARSDERETAAAALERLAGTITDTDWARGMLGRSRALVATDSDAESLYLDAIHHLTRCRATPQLARARLVYGEWLRRQQRRSDARAELRAAYGLFTAMGVGAFAERARGELAATGEPAPPTTPKRQGRFTAQEERIAQMAAEGLSNGEIASQLYISPRTVEYHLHKVFRTLGIGSRTQLAHEFARLDTFPD